MIDGPNGLSAEQAPERDASQDKEMTEVIVDMLEAHARASLEISQTNELYAKQVLQRAEAVRQLLNDRVGEVQGVVGTWFDGFKPIAETIFGTTIPENTAMELPITFGNYSPTVVAGIYGRVRRISLDEIMGPALALDLAAK